MRCEVLKTFRHAHNGFDVRTYEPGVQDLPEDAAKYAIDAKLAKAAPQETKAKKGAPEDK